MPRAPYTDQIDPNPPTPTPPSPTAQAPLHIPSDYTSHPNQLLQPRPLAQTTRSQNLLIGALLGTLLLLAGATALNLILTIISLSR